MPAECETYIKLAKLSSNHFLTGTNKLWGDQWLRAKTKANLKPELKMKVVSNTCDKELGSEIKSGSENYFKSSLENFQKPLPFRDIYVKYLEKNII